MNYFGLWVGLARVRVRTAHTLLLSLLLLLSGLSYGQHREAVLTLDDAIHKTMQNNPRLQMYEVRMRGLKGVRESAALTPAYELGAEVENFAGEGEIQGLRGSEQTVSLSSVIELGGKRSARVALVDARTGLLDARRRAEALDLLGEVTHGFVAALAAQERLNLEKDALVLARATLEAVEKRARAGVAPNAEVLRAKAALAKTKITLSRMQRVFEIEKTHLTSLWGAIETDFEELQGDLFQFPPADDFASLYDRAKGNAALAVFASETRLKEARIRLSQTRAKSDISWSLGVRRMEGSGDTGLVAGVSMPLFADRRSSGEIRAAQAERDQVTFRRKEALFNLHAQLFEAYQNRQQGVEVSAVLKEEVIPTLNRALRETRGAYERGRYSYLDLIAAQEELLAARRRMIDSAASVLQYGALIEQMTAEPLSTSRLSR
ncbi:MULTISPECIES: TolC family protein [unclassified Marinimicrobium]|jgi:cobalt-zinc-cadmium efflux system outer membrane protein|uniref:TolC family protein n=2 Tax=Marinimicrobium TaxID=359337 RepID=UPI000C62E937|nr:MULTISPECIES: TolC family protein [unclassified Marinimicrobium]MAN50306.1 transporter [Marinimicrobium sp.]MAN50342.1 transporter [Marinimicrobium sp.]